MVDWVNIFRRFDCDLPGGVSRARSHDDAVRILESLKDRAKSTYKKLAFECHPDRNGGDDTRIKELNAYYDSIKNAQYILPQPIPMIRVVCWTGDAVTTNTSSYSTYWGF